MPRSALCSLAVVLWMGSSVAPALAGEPTSIHLVNEIPSCGNLIVEGDEECDDGNQDAGDGCSADCGRTPLVGSALHHDVSPPLAAIGAGSSGASASAAGFEDAGVGEEGVELPLRIPTRPSPSPMGARAAAAAAAAPAPPAAGMASLVPDSDGPAPVPAETPPVSLGFEGLSDDDNAAVVGIRFVPPDTEGDIGPNHYVQWINVIFQIWEISRDGAGNPTGATPVFPRPLPGNAIWAGFGGFCQANNDGDPIVLYDHLADRWLLSQFSVDEGIQCVALSRTPDPAGSYDRWAFLVSPGETNDYPKFGVMPDAYYLSLRDFPSSNGLASAVAFDRADMLGGGGAPTFIKFTLPCLANDCVDGFQPPHLEGPPPAAGSPGIFTKVWDDDLDGPLTGVDGIRLWEFRPDFANPPASSFVELPIVPSSADFDNTMCGFFDRDCIPQRSSSQRLDPLDELQMYRAQYRHFELHDSLLVNSTVDATGTDVAGIYWSELRNSGSGWMQFQDGTYAPPDGENRWMGSIAMDSEGNIALGFSVSSSSTDPSIRYVTRESGDPLGTLPGGEVEVVAGGGAQLDSNRWGDYSTMSVDPVADCTFWYTQQYYAGTNSFDFKTRIAVFKIEGCNGVEPPPPPAPEPGLHGSSRDGQLFTLDLATGQGTLIGDLPHEVTEIEFNALTGRAFAQAPDGSFFGTEFDVVTGGAIGLPIFNGGSFTGLEYVGPTLYGTVVTDGGGAAPSTLRTLDPSTGVSTTIGLTGTGAISGLAHDRSSGIMYGIRGGPGPADLLEIDLLTGVASIIGSTGIQAGSLQFGPDGSLYAGGSGPDAGTLFRIDPATAASSVVGATGFGTVTGLTLVLPEQPAGITVSFNVEAGFLDSTLGGEVVRPVDAVNLSTGELVFSAFPDTILEDIDAFHLLPEGKVVFSTSTDVTQGFGGIPNIKNGDLVLWDGAEASLLFSEVVGFGGANNNIDAFSILPNGNWLLSTDLNATLGGLFFQNGDIVEYDPAADVATLYQGLDEATIFTGTPNSNADIDALHAKADGTVIFSIRSGGIGRVGNGPTYAFADAPRTDLFEIDPATLDARLFLDGDGLFDGVARNLDAVSLPPGELFFPEGPQAFVREIDLVGWELCDSRPYSSATGLALDAILENCHKDKLLLACRETENRFITLLAAAPRADVLFETGTGNTPHVANGSGWYFNDDWSWGFAVEGDPINRDACDLRVPINQSLRLCWHTVQFSAGGFRCGAQDFLNNSNAWEKLIYHAD